MKLGAREPEELCPAILSSQLASQAFNYWLHFVSFLMVCSSFIHGFYSAYVLFVLNIVVVLIASRLEQNSEEVT